MWISRRPDREAEVHVVVQELGLNAEAMSFTARFAAVGSEPDMVRRAWDLDVVAAQYADFVETFQALRPASDQDVMLAQTRRFPFLDPRLPARLLPEGWIGDRARELFAARHAEWAPGVQRRWDELTRE